MQFVDEAASSSFGGDNVFIVWGTKIKKKRLGYVADCCPVCNDVRRFELRRVGAASHLYYISFGQGRMLGHEAACCSCSTTLEVNADRYQAVERSAAANLEALVATTNPSVPTILGERLAALERARDGSSEERSALLREPFLLLNVMIEQQMRDRKLSKAGKWTCWSTIALLVVLAMIGANGGPRWAGIAVGLVFAAAFFVTLAFMATHMGSFVRREVYPKLALALEPLRPSVEELDQLTSNLKGLGLRVGKKVKAARLYGAIAEREAVHSTG